MQVTVDGVNFCYGLECFYVKYKSLFQQPVNCLVDVMYPMSYKLVHAVVLSNDSLYVFVLVYIS